MQNLFDPERHCGSPSATRDGAPCRRDKGTATDHFGSGLCRSHEILAAGGSLALGPRPFNAKTQCGSPGKRCKSDPPTCNHKDGDHRCRNGKGAKAGHSGSGHCLHHGGPTKNGRKHAATSLATAAVAKLQVVGKLGLPVGTGDPFALLEKAVRYAEGYLEATAQLLVEVVEKTRTDVSLEAAAGIHVRAIRQGATTGNQAVEANVADRQAKIGEQLGKVVVLAVQAALDRAGVAGDMRILAEAAAAEILDVRVPVGAELN